MAVSRAGTIAARFERFHADNPHVYESIVATVQRLWRRGIRRYSINGIYEVLRYQHAMQTKGDTFKLNNDFRALYARRVMEEYPQFRGFFETRERIAA
jgi:hypothetical protein